MNYLQSKKQFLTFDINKVIYGMDICLVTEIIGMQQYTLIPELPPYVRGIMNLRGKIIPLIDVRMRLYHEETVYDERTCVIVITIGEDEIGLIVDRVHEVISVGNKEEILKIEEETGNFISKMIKVNEQVFMILDIKKLIMIE